MKKIAVMVCACFLAGCVCGPPKPFLPGVDSLALQAEEMIDTLKDGEHHLLPGDVSLLRGAEAEKNAERSIENLVPVVHSLLPVLIDLAKALLQENEECEEKGFDK